VVARDDQLVEMMIAHVDVGRHPRRVRATDHCIANNSLPAEHNLRQKGRGSPYSITERRVPELIPVLDSQPAGDVNHKPGGRLPLLPAVTPATLKRAATNFAAW